MLGAFASSQAGLLGLIFFFAFFVGLVIWLLRPGAKEKAKRDARIPLEEDQDNGK